MRHYSLTELFIDAFDLQNKMVSIEYWVFHANRILSIVQLEDNQVNNGRLVATKYHYISNISLEIIRVNDLVCELNLRQEFLVKKMS